MKEPSPRFGRPFPYQAPTPNAILTNIRISEDERGGRDGVSAAHGVLPLWADPRDEGFTALVRENKKVSPNREDFLNFSVVSFLFYLFRQLSTRFEFYNLLGFDVDFFPGLGVAAFTRGALGYRK